MAAAIEEELVHLEITTSELRSRLGEPGLSVVDVRPLSRYNGWRETGASRGGHLPGAVALPASWLSRLDECELELMLDEKGITDAHRGRCLRRRRSGGRSCGSGSLTGHRGPDPHLHGLGRLDRRRESATRTACPIRAARRLGLALRAARRWQAGIRSFRAIPPVSRQLRGPRGVRRQPPGQRRSTWTPTCSRARATGIDALPRISTQHSAHSVSRPTPP